MSTTSKHRDLARALQDKDARQQYLHPKKRGLLALLWRMYEPVRKSPKIIWASISYALTSGVLPLLGVLVTYVLVGLLSAPNATPQSMLLAAGTYGVVFFICAAISQQVKNRSDVWFTRERLRLLELCNFKMMSMDLGLYENAPFMDDIETAFWSFSSNNDGLEGTFHKIFELGGTLVSAVRWAFYSAASA